MATGDEGSGGRPESELRDDDRPSASPYSGARQRSRYGLVYLLGILVAGSLLAYGLLHRGEVGVTGKDQATASTGR